MPILRKLDQASPHASGALDQAFTRRGDWPRIAANAVRCVENERTWARSVARYADVYASVQAQPPRAPAATSAREA